MTQEERAEFEQEFRAAFLRSIAGAFAAYMTLAFTSKEERRWLNRYYDEHGCLPVGAAYPPRAPWSAWR